MLTGSAKRFKPYRLHKDRQTLAGRILQMMNITQTTLRIATRGQGLYDVTEPIRDCLADGRGVGVCHVFVQHTSCSLLIQENADPTARADLEQWMQRLVPENDSLYTHTLEGPDDMPAHIRAALTATSLTVPIRDGQLYLGTWQGIYLWEHRHAGHERSLVVTVQQMAASS